MDLEIIGLLVLAAKVIGDTLLTDLAYATGLFTLLFSLTTMAAAWSFFRRGLRCALGAGESPHLPAVTILKPLKGMEPELYENLASFCRLDYPRFQLLFAVSNPEDPALDVLSRLRQDFPAVDIEIVVSKNRIGFNPKVNNLSNTAPFIKHDLWLISDSDIRVRPDFLRRAVAPFADPTLGLVTCFYRSAEPASLWLRLEALSVNAHFLPQALAASVFGMKFAMGAAILVRREAFEAGGGFSNLADHLADDFILGDSIQQAGYRLEFARDAVLSVPGVADASEHMRHQVRWARTIRICQPAGYFASVLSHGFSFLTLRLFLVGFDAWSAALALAIVASKFAAMAWIGRGFHGSPAGLWGLGLLPLSEWIAFGAWLSGFRSQRVLWRGEYYTVQAKGRLKPAEPALKVRVAVAGKP